MFLLVGLSLCALGGLYIGSCKGHPIAGLILGFLFGPLGWLIVALCADDRSRCPQCAELVHSGARLCPHCRLEIAWISGQPMARDVRSAQAEPVDAEEERRFRKIMYGETAPAGDFDRAIDEELRAARGAQARKP